MVKDAVVAESDLVDGVRRKDVRFREGRVASVIVDVLVAAEGVLLSPCGRTAGHKVSSLIVTEPGKDRIVVGNVMVEANVESAFIQFPDGLVNVVVARRIGVRRGIELQYFGADLGLLQRLE